jgi:hypothetical protein
MSENLLNSLLDSRVVQAAAAISATFGLAAGNADAKIIHFTSSISPVIGTPNMIHSDLDPTTIADEITQDITANDGQMVPESVSLSISEFSATGNCIDSSELSGVSISSSNESIQNCDGTSEQNNGSESSFLASTLYSESNSVAKDLSVNTYNATSFQGTTSTQTTTQPSATFEYSCPPEDSENGETYVSSLVIGATGNVQEGFCSTSQPASPGGKPDVIAPKHVVKGSNLITYKIEIPQMNGDASVSLLSHSKLISLEMVGNKAVSAGNSNTEWPIGESKNTAGQNTGDEDLTFSLKKGAKLGSKACATMLIDESDGNSAWNRENDYTIEECTTINNSAYNFQDVHLQASNAFLKLYASGASLDFRKVVIEPHYLEFAGSCNPDNPSAPSDMEIIDSSRGQTSVSCATTDGKHQTLTFPRHIFPPSERKVNYSSLLAEEGGDAAKVVGLDPSAQGRVKKVNASQSEVDISFANHKRGTQGIALKSYKLFKKARGYSVKVSEYKR